MRNGTAELVTRDQILRRQRGQGNIHFPCSADHEQDWQPYPVDPYSCYMRDHTYCSCYRCLLIGCRQVGLQSPTIIIILLRIAVNSHHISIAIIAVQYCRVQEMFGGTTIALPYGRRGMARQTLK